MTKLLSIRLVAILVGLGFAIIALYSFVTGAYAWMTEEPAGHKRRISPIPSTALSANGTSSSCSAASRSMTRSARPATASSSSPSAISNSLAMTKAR
jgi:hypothetical protein